MLCSDSGLRAAGTRPALLRQIDWLPDEYEAHCAKWRALKLSGQPAVRSLQGLPVL